MVVAATAMFFAVASSAFILRARMATRCPSHSYPAATSPVTAVEVDPVPTPTRTRAVPNDNCGKPHVVTGADGKDAVYFTVCPPGAKTSPPADKIAPTSSFNTWQRYGGGEQTDDKVTRGIEVRSATPAP